MDYYNYRNVVKYCRTYNRKLYTNEYIVFSLYTTYSKNHLAISYTLNEVLPHNIRGPAYINYYENGIKEREVFWINGNLRNSGGPAHIEYYKNGKKRLEEYFINHKFFTKHYAEDN